MCGRKSRRYAKQLSGPERAKAAQEMTEYLQLAENYGREFSPPLVVVVSGLMGSGKSTLAQALAEKLACEVLQTDALRRELLGPAAESEVESPAFDAGRYSPANRERIYEEMFTRAAATLADGESVILDGTFVAADLLRRTAAIAGRASATLLVVHAIVPRMSRTRIAARLAEGAARPKRSQAIDQQQLALEPVPGAIASRNRYNAQRSASRRTRS